MPTWETEDRKHAKASLKPPQPAKHQTVGGVSVRQAVAVATHAPAAALHPVQPQPASAGVRRAPSTPSRTTAPQQRVGTRLGHPAPVHASTALRPSTTAQPVASREAPRAQPNDALSQLHHRAGRVVMEVPHHSEVALHPGRQPQRVVTTTKRTLAGSMPTPQPPGSFAAPRPGVLVSKPVSSGGITRLKVQVTDRLSKDDALDLLHPSLKSTLRDKILGKIADEIQSRLEDAVHVPDAMAEAISLYGQITDREIHLAANNYDKAYGIRQVKRGTPAYTTVLYTIEVAPNTGFQVTAVQARFWAGPVH